MKKNEPLFWVVLIVGALTIGYCSPNVFISGIGGLCYGWMLSDIWPRYYA